MITSGAEIFNVNAAPDSAIAINDLKDSWIIAEASSDEKCVRCWHHQPDIGNHVEHPELCGRCVDNVAGSGEARKYA